MIISSSSACIGLLLGGPGLIVGAMLGGKKKDRTFIGTFKDGRRFMATADKKTYMSLQMASLNN
ncbi:MAG: hypothetical protein OIF36_03805 [Alphaproteobacteria bacterium]|nr:hypothetical protein [Alphaproteobacteria bacterium]